MQLSCIILDKDKSTDYPLIIHWSKQEFFKKT